MRSRKYYYNQGTLQYEVYKRPTRLKLLRFFGYFSAILITSAVLYFLADAYLPSQEKQALQREINQMKEKYEVINSHLEAMTEELTEVQNRDAGVHRYMFGLEPMDDGIWNGGIGGHDKYNDITLYPNSGELLVETQMKVDLLDRQLQLQEQSLKVIEAKAKERDEMMRCIPSIKPVRADLLKRDVTLLSGFGRRMHPVHKVVKMHTGIDFTAPRGTAVQATGDGVVEVVKRSRAGYGRHVVINHGFGYKTLYGHMDKITVKEGEQVKKGNQIGTVGSTGTSTAPHCHYEIRIDGKPINPIHLCLDGLSPAEYASVVERASAPNQSFD